MRDTNKNMVSINAFKTRNRYSVLSKIVRGLGGCENEIKKNDRYIF